MPLLGALTRDEALSAAVSRRVGPRGAVARASSWHRLLHLVRERPVTCAVLDAGALPPAFRPSTAVADLRTRFPSLAVVFVARPETELTTLLELGRAKAPGLVLTRLDDVEAELPRAGARALSTGTRALVTRVVSPFLSGRESDTLADALDGAQLGWGADDLARAAKLSRPHLSVRLTAVGLPPVGHLLGWAKMLHAGRWLTDPGRTAESVSRQLEYANGATFRRALRRYVGGTPTEVVESGGLLHVLERFLDACSFRGTGRPVRAA